jgi:alginate O-acetyltransferase complex protein AlgI
MVFSSNIFLFLFLPILLGCYFLCNFNIKFKNIILLVFSLIFYCFGEINFFWLLMLSVIFNYFFGLLIEKNINNLYKVKTILILSLIFNLGLLVYFKYCNFFIENFSKLLRTNHQLLDITLPLGISFFTFHSISYLVDIYRKKCQAQRNFFSLMLYICFFPQLIAGPIVRYNFIVKYLSDRKIYSHTIAYGLRLFIIGITKKVIIANPLGEIADEVFLLPQEGLDRWLVFLGVFAYTLQIYFDFSGYSDMAIGLARIFGFRFPKNFNYPYIALSIKDFWRRWHISLSSWFRDYLYIPLGGNRVSLSRQYLNLFIVFLLCGLWHGASWNFIIWGLFHGLFLVLERLRTYNNILEKTPIIIRNLYALIIIMIAWIWFRTNNLEHALLFFKVLVFDQSQVVYSHRILSLLNSNYHLMVILLALISYHPLIFNYIKKLLKKSRYMILFFDVILLFLFIFVIIRLSAQTYNPFIYFQF